MRVAQLGVLQEVGPGALQPVAEEVQVVPGFLFLILAVLRDDGARGAPKPGRHARERQHAAHERGEEYQHDGQVDERVQ